MQKECTRCRYITIIHIDRCRKSVWWNLYYFPLNKWFLFKTLLPFKFHIIRPSAGNMYKYLKYIWKPRGWELLWKKSATYIPRFKRETDFRLGGEQNSRGVAWKIEERHSASNSSATTLSLGQGRGNWLTRVFVMKRIRTALDNCAHRSFQPRSKQIFSLKISSVWIYARV